MKIFNCIYFFILSALLSASCSKGLDAINENTPVERNKIISVIGLDWNENYYIEDINQTFTRDGIEFFNSRNDLDEQGESIHINFWNYITNLQFIAENNDETFYWFEFQPRYKEQPLYKAYALNGGDFELKNLLFDTEAQSSEKDGSISLNSKITENYKLPDISWEQDPGNINYLGDIRIFFKTTKGSKSLIGNRYYNKSVEIEYLVILDQFDKSLEYWKENEQWFPVDQMQNISKEKFYRKISSGWEEITEEEFENRNNKEKRDTEKFFY